MERKLKRYLEAGKIVGTHGVRGELRMEPWCDSAEVFKSLRFLYWDKDGQKEVGVLSARPHKTLVLLRLQGVETVEQGDALRGKILYLDREDVRLPEGRYFIEDLIGLEVFDADTNARYGVLTEVMATGANDVYEVTSPEGKPYLVPAIRDVVVRVCPEEGRMLLRPIGGMFGDAD